MRFAHGRARSLSEYSGNGSFGRHCTAPRIAFYFLELPLGLESVFAASAMLFAEFFTKYITTNPGIVFHKEGEYEGARIEVTTTTREIRNRAFAIIRKRSLNGFFVVLSGTNAPHMKHCFSVAVNGDSHW